MTTESFENFVVKYGLYYREYKWPFFMRKLILRQQSSSCTYQFSVDNFDCIIGPRVISESEVVLTLNFLTQVLYYLILEMGALVGYPLVYMPETCDPPDKVISGDFCGCSSCGLELYIPVEIVLQLLSLTPGNMMQKSK